MSLTAINNIHLISASEGNSLFCFPECLNVSRDEVEVASSAESMSLIIVEPDRPEIDLSSKYFKSQIMRQEDHCYPHLA
jgi:hypothetical protein